MLKELILATAIVILPIASNADSVSISKDKKSTTRVETRSYWEFREDDNPKKAGWKLRKDRLYVTEPSEKNEKRGK